MNPKRCYYCNLPLTTTEGGRLIYFQRIVELKSGIPISALLHPECVNAFDKQHEQPTQLELFSPKGA